jgi:uncharacterized pyridoxal phosphate-containing UPF0001 family protein
LLEKINKASCANGKIERILLEINVSGEESKFGLRDENKIFDIASKTVDLRQIEFRGLMTMAPYGAEEIKLRNIFSHLRLLGEKISSSFALGRLELSMGMSSDYVIAVEEFASMIRVGTGIFT